MKLILLVVNQALAYEKLRRATIAGLVTKFRGYRRVKSHHPPSRPVVACDDYSF